MAAESQQEVAFAMLTTGVTVQPLALTVCVTELLVPPSSTTVSSTSYAPATVY
jgi:hypothetical protein